MCLSSGTAVSFVEAGVGWQSGGSCASGDLLRSVVDCSVMTKSLKFPVAVWSNKDERRYYAFPLGAKDVLGDTIYPAIDNLTWEYRGTLPQGTPVQDVRPDRGDRVTCTLGGVKVYTAKWAITESEA